MKNTETIKTIEKYINGEIETIDEKIVYELHIKKYNVSHIPLFTRLLKNLNLQPSDIKEIIDGMKIPDSEYENILKNLSEDEQSQVEDLDWNAKKQWITINKIDNSKMIDMGLNLFNLILSKYDLVHIDFITILGYGVSLDSKYINELPMEFLYLIVKRIITETNIKGLLKRFIGMGA